MEKTSTGLHEKAVKFFFSPGAADANEDSAPLVKKESEPIVKKLPGAVEERRDVPSLAQFRIAFTVAQKKTLAVGTNYEDRCELARQSGDTSVSYRRSTAFVGRQIVSSISAAMLEQHREALRHKKVEMMCIAQDVRKGLELVKLQCVYRDLSTETVMMDLRDIHGSKTALSKSKDMHIN